MSQTKVNQAQPATGNGKLIYVVDDEPMLLELATVVLEPLGYAVKTFRSPDVATKTYAAAQPCPDLIITDYAMHMMNGMDLLKSCRRLQPRQKILLVSGTVGEEVFRHSACKPDRFLAKPYYAKQLVDTVQALLAD